VSPPVPNLPPASRVLWPRTHRLVNAHFPPIDLYDDIADPADWERVTAAVQRTNPRILDEIGDLRLVPVERRLGGPGASWVMAAFTHVSPDRQSRFSNGGFGVYYAGESVATALHEHSFHMGRFYRRTNEPPGWISQARELIGRIDADLIDLRIGVFPDLLDPDPECYGAAQAFAAHAREAGADGVVYPSLRRPGGECIAAFWPNVVSPPTQGDHYRYHWNGEVVDFARKITGDRAIYDMKRY